MKFLGALLFASLLSLPVMALEVGDDTPCVDLQDIQTDGSVITQCIQTKSNDTAKYVVLEFFSATCGACTANLPNLSLLAKNISKQASVRLVSVDRQTTVTTSYVNSHRELIQFPVAMDLQRVGTRAYGVTATPTTFVVNADGKIVFKSIGTFSPEDMAQITEIVSH